MPPVETQEIFLPESQQQVIDGKRFPQVLQLTSNSSHEECSEWLRNNQQFLEQQLVDYGAMILRGFPVETPEKLHDFLIPNLQWDFRLKYTGGGGPRNIVIGPIYNSTESPPEFIIPFHHEMVYLTRFPERLIFYCDIAPSKDGETPLLYSNEVIKSLREINPEFVAKLKEKGVRYIRNVKSKHTGGEFLKYQKGWQDIFETEDRNLAEQLARECGTEKIEWEDDTMILTTIVFDGIAVESQTKLETWFNAICLLHPAAHEGKQYVPWNVVYGDFSPIESDDVKSAIDIMAKAGIKPKWQQGDIMLVNNRLAMHGRNSFEPPRRILAGFAS